MAGQISPGARGVDVAHVLRAVRAGRHPHPDGPHRVVVFAVWNLALKIFHAVLAPQGFDPTDYSVFQAIFGAIFTVIIALEFKRSLLVVAERKESIVQVRTVILIALLAIVRKLIILDLTSTDALQLFALAAAILALGAVYWLVRDQDRSIERDRPAQKRKLARPSSA